jgi:hypothetical protein
MIKEAPEQKELMKLSTSKSSSSFDVKTSSLLCKTDFSEKHVLRLAGILAKNDPQRRLYPNGLLTEVEEDNYDSTFDFRPVKRIELFATDKHTKATYGVIRNLFVGFSSERSLLDLANFSDNIISVRTVQSKIKSRSLCSHDAKVIEDKLVLRRFQGRPDNRSPSEDVYRRTKTPSLFVSPRWLDKMELSSGDKIMVSNPLENYAAAPPQLHEAEKTAVSKESRIDD